MRSLEAVTAIYQAFVTSRDHVQACEISREILHEALKEVPNDAYERKVAKIIELGRHAPQPKFAEFLRELALSPEAVGPDAVGLVTPSSTLATEAAEQTIARLIDVPGRTVDRLIRDFAQTEQYEPVVLLRTRQRLSDVLNDKPYQAGAEVQRLFARLQKDDGLAMRALWKCVDLLDCSDACIDLGLIQLALRARTQEFLKARESGQTLPPLAARKPEEAQAARLLLLLLTLQEPDAFPSLEELPELATDLTLVLQEMVPGLFSESERLQRANVLLTIIKEKKEGSQATLDALPWPTDLKQAAHAMCAIVEQTDTWAHKLAPQARQIAREEATAYANTKVAKRPDNVDARLMRATLFVRMGRDKEAVNDARVAQKAQQCVEAFRLEAVALANLGKFAEADAAASRAETLSEKAGGEERFRVQHVKNLVLRAELRLKLQRPWEAYADLCRAELLGRGLVQDPIRPQVEQAEAALWYEQLDRLESDRDCAGMRALVEGHDAFKARRWSDAVAAFTRASSQNATLTLARMGRDLACDMHAFDERVAQLWQQLAAASEAS